MREGDREEHFVVGKLKRVEKMKGDKQTEKEEKLLFCGSCWCCCGCSWHDTVLTTLRWERLPERQQRTQEEPAPCELGLSALHGQETAHRQTLKAAHQSSCCHNNPPCALLLGTACLVRQQQGPRREADTHTVTQQSNTHIETGCD